MKKMAEKVMSNAQQRTQYQSSNRTYGYQTFGGQQHKQQQSRNDGKVRVDYIPPKEEDRKGTSTAGEFVDFEEVK